VKIRYCSEIARREAISIAVGKEMNEKNIKGI